MVDKSLKEWMWQVTSSGGGGDHEELTQAEYDALTEEEKTNGAVYFITDGTPSGIQFDTLYSGNKFISGTLSLLKSYTDYDLIFVETAINADSASGIFTPNRISTSMAYDISVFIQNGTSYYASNCQIKRSSDNSFAVTEQHNNANFQQGITKVMGIKF